MTTPLEELLTVKSMESEDSEKDIVSTEDVTVAKTHISYPASTKYLTKAARRAANTKLLRPTGDLYQVLGKRKHCESNVSSPLRSSGAYAAERIELRGKRGDASDIAARILRRRMRAWINSLAQSPYPTSGVSFSGSSRRAKTNKPSAARKMMLRTESHCSSGSRGAKLQWHGGSIRHQRTVLLQRRKSKWTEPREGLDRFLPRVLKLCTIRTR